MSHEGGTREEPPVYQDRKGEEIEGTVLATRLNCYCTFKFVIFVNNNRRETLDSVNEMLVDED